MEINGRYFLDDPESGRMYGVSKEYHDHYYAMWDAMMERVRSMIDVAKMQKGIILITSTPADVNEDIDFKKFWQ